MGMVFESPSPFRTLDGPLMESWRVWNIANMALGRDEQIFIPRDVIGEMTDPSFTRVRDSVMFDIVLQLESPIGTNSSAPGSVEEFYDSSSDSKQDILEDSSTDLVFEEQISSAGLAAEYKTMLSSLLHHVTSALRDPAATLLPQQPETPQTYPFITLPAIASTGMGAAPIIDVPDAPDPSQPRSESLIWSNIYFAGDGCRTKLPDDAAKKHEIIVMRRGGCTFSEKLSNIPSFTPTTRSLKLVILISGVTDENDKWQEEGWPAGSGASLFRPLLDKVQVTPSGLVRHHQICMVMVGGGDELEELFRKTRSIGLRRRYHIESQGLVVGNIIVV
jgi:hypothetical protein